MGYTHYYEYTEISQDSWDKILKDCKKVVLSTEISIGDASFTNNEVCFNGVGDDAHETFCLKRIGSGGFEFCKTAMKPYDLIVCACLLVYKHHSPDTIDLSSDGGVKEWEESTALVNTILEY